MIGIRIIILTLVTLIASGLRVKTENSLKHPDHEWKAAYGGNIPSSAFVAGWNSEGNEIYVARGLIRGKYVLGKVRPKSKDAVFSVGDKKVSLHNYDVL